MKRSGRESEPRRVHHSSGASGRGVTALSVEQEKRALYYMALFWFLGAAAYLKRLGPDPQEWVASYANVAERSSLLVSQAGNAAGVLQELAVIRRSVPGARSQALRMTPDLAEAQLTCWAEGYQPLFRTFGLSYQERCHLCQPFYQTLGKRLGVDIAIESGPETCRLVVRKRVSAGQTAA